MPRRRRHWSGRSGRERGRARRGGARKSSLRATDGAAPLFRGVPCCDPRPSPLGTTLRHSEGPRKEPSVNTPVSSRESLAALDALDARIDGRVSFPGQPGWDEARTAWNLAVDQRPVAVVVAGSVGDIAGGRAHRRRPRPLGRTAGDRPQRRPARRIRRPRRHAPAAHVRAARRAGRPRPAASHASSPVRSGATSSPRSRRTASPRSPDRRTTSACSATPSAAA